MDLPGPPDGFGQGSPHRGIESGERRVQGGLRHPGRRQVHPVEPGGVLADGLGTTAPDVIADRADPGDGGLDVGPSARQDAGQRGPVQVG